MRAWRATPTIRGNTGEAMKKLDDLFDGILTAMVCVASVSVVVSVALAAFA